MSIGKSQALALADGFIDSIGSGSKDDLRPRNTFSELIQIAGELIEQSQKNLASNNSISSGALSSSLVAHEPVTTGSVVKIDIEMLPYGLFVNSGVKGTKSGSSTAGYAFKKDFPSRDFITSIIAWQGRGKLKSSNVKRSISAHESKNASISKLSSAFAIARSIMQKGLKPTGFLDKAVETTSQTVEDRLGKALEIDIITSLTR